MQEKLKEQLAARAELEDEIASENLAGVDAHGISCTGPKECSGECEEQTDE